TISYGGVSQINPTRVAGRDGHWVNYTWTPLTFQTPNGVVTGNYLTHVDYSDGTTADYTYGTVSYVSHDANGNPTTSYGQVLFTAQDTHADSAMRWIKYDYASTGN